MRISDWSSDVCSSDLPDGRGLDRAEAARVQRRCRSPGTIGAEQSALDRRPEWIASDLWRRSEAWSDIARRSWTTDPRKQAQDGSGNRNWQRSVGSAGGAGARVPACRPPGPPRVRPEAVRVGEERVWTCGTRWGAAHIDKNNQ